MKLLLSDAAKQQLRAIREKPGGSYLFIGSAQVGKATAAKTLARLLCENPLDTIIVSPVKTSIGIDQVLELQQQLQLKTAGSHRVAIIESAHLLTREAQNALLKLLEEPPAHTTIILTVDQTNTLAATVLSRCQKLYFVSFSQAAIAKFLQSEHGQSASIANQLAGLAEGAVGRAVELMNNPQQQDAGTQLRNLAQVLIEAPLYEKLVAIQKLPKDSDPGLIFHQVLRQLEMQLHETEQPQRAAKQLQAAERLLRYLEANGNTKLALDALALEMAL